ncbi:MAG: penicillin-binding protein 2 [Pseudomonadota bacterium]
MAKRETPGNDHKIRNSGSERSYSTTQQASRIVLVVTAMLLGVGLVAGQLIRLAVQGQDRPRIAAAAPVTDVISRPPIVDRDGRVLALDIRMPSLIADPSQIIDLEHTIDTLLAMLPNADRAGLRRKLSNADSRFAWIARKVSTARAEAVFHLGLPGINYRWETKRTYPAGQVAGHVLGAVNISNRGVAGLEAFLDRARGLTDRDGAKDGAFETGPVRTTIRLGVQHALEEELADAVATFQAAGASGIILDARSGEVAAIASVPEVDPAFPQDWVTNGPISLATAGTLELGSVFKLMTIAMGFDLGLVEPETLIATHKPIEIGKARISDGRARRKPLSVRDVFLKSSNVGAGRIALAAGAERQQAFLARLGLLGPIETEVGPLARPVAPKNWGELETVTISYGHGIALSPLQFAAAAATLVNGGYRVRPRFTIAHGLPDVVRTRVVRPETSAMVRRMMRSNVMDPSGSGAAADVPGYRVGGKTGTADVVGETGRYDGRDVNTSFVAAFPIDQPRYVVLVTLIHPKASKKTGGGRLAGDNAAPATARIIGRTAPLLGILPEQISPVAE